MSNPSESSGHGGKGELTLSAERLAELMPKVRTLLDDLRLLEELDDPTVEPAVSPAWGMDDDGRG